MDRRRISQVAVLDEPARLRIYELVRRARRPMTRDEVAAEAGVSRKLAAFHLDKLLERGLLKVHFARPPGRSGPGAGRTAKYYEPADQEIAVAVPERRYDLASELLVTAITTAGPDEDARDAALRVARDEGVALGERVRVERKLRRPSSDRALRIAGEVLDAQGFEPYRLNKQTVALRNCPFHALAQRAPEVMCTMNREFVEGLLQGLGAEGLEAVLACTRGDCCVTLMPRAR